MYNYKLRPSFDESGRAPRVLSRTHPGLDIARFINGAAVAQEVGGEQKTYGKWEIFDGE